MHRALTTLTTYVARSTNSTWSLADEYLHLQNEIASLTGTTSSEQSPTGVVQVRLTEVEIFDKINRREGPRETCRQHREVDSLE